MSWIVKDTSKEDPNARECEDEEEAKATKSDMVTLGADPSDIKIIPPTQDVEPDFVDQSEEAKADGGHNGVKVADTPDEDPREQPTQEEMEADPDILTSPEDLEQDAEAIDQLGESLDTDPLSILPGHMKDTIQGQPAINKRGYAMIAERYGISVKAFIESYPWENEEGRCVARAVAVTEDGKEYQDFATACDGDVDGDMPDQLVELASTRALKRVTGWATGLGIVSYQELADQLEEKYQ